MWIIFTWLAFFLETNGLSDLTAVETTACVLAFVVAPLVLMLIWSLALQGRLPTARQLGLILKSVVLAILVLAIVALIAIAIGYVKDSTPV